MGTTSPDGIYYNTSANAPVTEESRALTLATSVQTALNGKAASSHTHAASDITSGSLDVARGGTGATTGSGLVPIIPTGGSYSSVSANGLITFSNGVQVNGIFSANYDNYRIILNVTSATGNDYLYFRFCAGGSVNFENVYYNSSIYHQVTSVSSWSNGSTVRNYAGRLGYYLSDNATYATFDINGAYGTATKTNVIFQSKYYATNPTYVAGAVGFNSTTSLDGMIFGGEAGTGNPNGTMQIFGYRK